MIAGHDFILDKEVSSGEKWGARKSKEETEKQGKGIHFLHLTVK